VSTDVSHGASEDTENVIQNAIAVEQHRYFLANGKSFYVKTILSLVALLLIPSFVAAQTPQQVADELLAADRAFSDASARTDLISGLSAMFADDVLMPNPAGIAAGKQNAINALRANPANLKARIEWTPLRAALSGDGRHGFTAGFMLMSPAAGPAVPLKYLAYWERQTAGWRVLAYKRGGAAKEMPPLTPLGNVLPAKLVEATTDASLIEQYRKSLADAETAFSDEAQKIGTGAAFVRYGSPDALNLGGPAAPTFLIGNQAIGAAVGAGEPPTGSQVRWGPDVKTIVAASGDFGVTIGHIFPNAPGADGKPQPGRPFFTIWRRDSVTAPWRYIAE
jgi:ketosteroid isomerase-like protein